MDRFLALHQVGSNPRLFDLSRRHRSISVRDQMIRASMMAERLSAWFHSVEHPVSEKILVIGSGACGVSLSLALAEKNHQVLLCDGLEEPFQLQRASTQRWIDPTQYDWPLDHFKRGTFPLGPDYELAPNIPLPWKAGFASKIVSFQWHPRFVRRWQHYEALGRFEFRGRTWVDLDRRKDLVADATQAFVGIRTVLWDLAPDDRPQRYKESFAAVVLTGGFGDEKTTCPIASQDGYYFFGPLFWSDDNLQTLDRSKTVVISGSGDGAMQDLIRICSGFDSAKELLKEIHVPLNHPAFNSIRSAEQRLERSLAWRNDDLEESFFDDQYKRLHRFYLSAIGRLLRYDPTLPQTVLELTKNAPKAVHLISSTPYFTCNYPLNRFLGYLLALILKRTKIAFHPNRRLKQVRPLGTTPLSSELSIPLDKLTPKKVSARASICEERQWSVDMVPASDPDSLPVQTVTPVDRLIIRHGLLDVRIPEFQTAQSNMPQGPDPDPPFLVST